LFELVTVNLQHGSPNVMDFHKILYAYAPCKSELNKKKLSLSYLGLELCYFKEFTWKTLFCFMHD